MTIETKTYGIEIFADEGKAIRHKDDPRAKTTMTSVCIPLAQDPNEWRDCEYSEDGDPSFVAATNKVVAAGIATADEIAAFL